MAVSILTLLAGFALLIFGGELLVRGSVKLAERAGVSPLVVGLVIVGFGTSMPELVASVQAAASGAPGLAWGNIAGSNLANTFLILGSAAVLAPFVVSERGLWRDTLAAFGATLIFYGFALASWDGRIAGTVLLVLLVGYLYYAYRQESGEATEHSAAYDRSTARESVQMFADKPGNGWLIPIILTLLGLVLLIIGGGWLVSGAVALAGQFGMSETAIGLSVVAIGTSSPELITSSMAALRREGELAFGNVVGSNIYNMMGIGGFTAIVAPNSLPRELLSTEFPLLLGSAIVLVALAAMGGKFNRLTGAVLLGAYLFYMWGLLASV